MGQRLGVPVIGASSAIGGRQFQQDMFYSEIVDSTYAFAIVCDGMGGMDGGALASSTAVNFLKDRLKNLKYEDNLDERMVELVISANEKVQQLENPAGEPLGAGTTMVAVIIKDGFMRWISVGDSKLYALKSGKFFSLTNEHNYAFMAQQRAGDESFEYDPLVRQDALVSYIGSPRMNYIDIHPEPLELKEGDAAVLCTDGLYKVLEEQRIIEYLFSDDIEKASEDMVRAACEKGGARQDNTTAVVIRIESGIAKEEENEIT